MPATRRNCAAPLLGPCGAPCGQRAHDRARSLGALRNHAWHVRSRLGAGVWSALALPLGNAGQLMLATLASVSLAYPVSRVLAIAGTLLGSTLVA